MAQGWTGNKWGFSSKEKPLHFSTAELSTLNKGLHPGTPTPLTHGGGGNGDGEAKGARGRVTTELPGLGGTRFPRPSLPLLPAPWQSLQALQAGVPSLGTVPDAMVVPRHHGPWRSAAARCRRSQRGRSRGERGQQDSHSSPGEKG